MRALRGAIRRRATGRRHFAVDQRWPEAIHPSYDVDGVMVDECRPLVILASDYLLMGVDTIHRRQKRFRRSRVIGIAVSERPSDGVCADMSINIHVLALLRHDAG